MREMPIPAQHGEQDQPISDALLKERRRLWEFIRRRIPDARDAEDILQDVLYEFIAAYRLITPIEQAGAWLLRVARNRIIDFHRKKKPQSIHATLEDGGQFSIEDLLPSADAGPEAAYARELLLDEIYAALDELPDEQREVFIAHEIEGRSFKEIAAQTCVGVNTLLSRKRYAVLHLRERLQAIYEDFRR
jgi:RNA polymerase sigma factor (sigma-70 family)